MISQTFVPVLVFFITSAVCALTFHQYKVSGKFAAFRVFAVGLFVLGYTAEIQGWISSAELIHGNYKAVESIIFVFALTLAIWALTFQQYKLLGKTAAVSMFAVGTFILAYTSETLGWVSLTEPMSNQTDSVPNLQEESNSL